ncbi:zinc ribbon domain-containing protein [Actinokineospora soli]|uniref:Zinc ribbon domain-containing protein n=1 Tax=Actinokineospora soli TaxID=1048753 RepID=A0ABW2TS72_9PSEU
MPQETKPTQPTTKKRPPTNKLKPGDLVCGECGEGNAPTRKFCSRCGTSLADAVVVKTPWWRRLLPKGGAKVKKTGDRPKGTRQGKSKFAEAAGRVFRATRTVLSVLLLIAGIVYGVSSQFRGWVNERALGAKQWVEELVLPQYDPVSPVSVKATAQLKDHPGKAAVDGNTKSFWAAPGTAKPILVLTYDRPVDLEKAIVRTGAQDGFQGMHRPRKLHLVFSTGKTADVELKDQPDPQEVSFENGEGATSVEIHIVEVIKSIDGDEMAFTEIEMFVRR